MFAYDAEKQEDDVENTSSANSVKKIKYVMMRKIYKATRVRIFKIHECYNDQKDFNLC